jgi:diguanylate cyclase (GGDEF)-like protein
MSAAAFVLIINLFISAIFAVAFGSVAAYQRNSTAARWLAAAYAMGIFNVALEFILPYQADPNLVGIAIFAAFLFGLGFCIIGLARHYRVGLPWPVMGAIWAASLAGAVVIIDWPRDDLARMLLYQGPYATIMLLGVWVILQLERRRASEFALLVLCALGAVNFLAKPFIALAIGSGGGPQGYMASTYAAISQTTGACLLIANGLLMVLTMVRDVLAEMTARSQTDALSGLLNRRGFDERVAPSLSVLRRAGLPASMLIADLDNFKQVNDAYGHDAGDRVIAAFAAVLRHAAGDHFVVARFGGEEFAVFLPGIEAPAARLFAESVRSGFAAHAMPFLAPTSRPTVSIGVAQMGLDETEAEALRRADQALYEAKRDGRNRVRVATAANDAMVRHPMRARLRPGT